MNKKIERAIIIDFETTGLLLHRAVKPELQPRPIEFGGIVIDGEYNIIKEYDLLINPEMAITDEITKITGLTNDDLKDCPTFSEIYYKLYRAFFGCAALIAHNAPFDVMILRHALKRMENRAGLNDVTVANFPWPEKSICTIQAFAHNYEKYPKLIKLYKDIMNKELDQTHRALDDCRALYDIVKAARLLDCF